MIYPNVIKKDGSQRGILVHNFKTKNNKFSIMLMDKDWKATHDKPVTFIGTDEIVREWEIFNFK